MSAWVAALWVVSVMGSGMAMSVTLRPPELSGDGTLAPATVDKALKARQAYLAHCAERAALHGANVSGKLTLTWKILPDGKVDGSPRTNGTLASSEVVACVRQQVSMIRFPAPSGGGVTVKLTLLVQPREFQVRTGTHLSDARVFESAKGLFKEPCEVLSGTLDAAALSQRARERRTQVLKCADLAKPPPPAPPPPPQPAGATTGADAGVIRDLLQKLTRSGPLSHDLSGLLGRSFAVAQAEWNVTANGAVEDMKVTRGGVRASEVEACLSSEVSTWNLPRGEASVRCTLNPIILSREPIKPRASGTAAKLLSGSGPMPPHYSEDSGREPYPDGAPKVVRERSAPGLVANATHYDPLGDVIQVETWDAGRPVPVARYASGKRIDETAPYPPPCGKLALSELPPAGFDSASDVAYRGFVGPALTFIAERDGGLEARVFEDSQWAAVLGGPRDVGPHFDVEPFEGGRLFVKSQAPVPPWVLDVPGRTWQPVPRLPEAHGLTLVGRSCVYAFKRPAYVTEVRGGLSWCLGDAEWRELPDPGMLDVAAQVASAEGDDLVAVTRDVLPERVLAAGYDAKARAWTPLSVPGENAAPRLFTVPGGAVLVDSSPRGGTGGPRRTTFLFSSRGGEWTGLWIDGSRRPAPSSRQPEAPRALAARALALMGPAARDAGLLLFDGTRRRWSVVPEAATGWPQYLWADGRLRPVSAGNPTPRPALSVLDWDTGRWCQAWLDHPSLESRQETKPKSTYRLLMGDHALVVWGRDDVTQVPCGAPACPTPQTVERHTELSLIATWPDARPMAHPRAPSERYGDQCTSNFECGPYEYCGVGPRCAGGPFRLRCLPGPGPQPPCHGSKR